MFIPPKGAMQFEIIPNGIDDAPMAALSWKDKETDCIWVYMPPVKIGRCPCPESYLVVLESLPPRMRTLAKMKMQQCNNAANIAVCNCMGRLIE
jgi:hypothetical protein